MLLHYEHPGPGSVLGLDFEQHFLDVPDHLTAAVLENPHWRPATDEEQATYSAPLHDADNDDAGSDGGETCAVTTEGVDRRSIRSTRRTRAQVTE